MSDEISLARGWTLEAYVAHNEAMREQDVRLQAEVDRRYTEVGVEREKALKIKETADLAALGLAREIQTYKDEKANELRSQIERERGSYTTRPEMNAAVEKLEAIVKPAIDFVSSAQGSKETVATIYARLAIVAVIAGVLGHYVH